MVDKTSNNPESVDDESTRSLLKQLTKMVESLQATVESLQATIVQKDEELAELRRLVFGKKSEKMPPMNREVKRVKQKTPAQKEAAKKKAKKKEMKTPRSKRNSQPKK